ncbi:MAG: hypothetical protein Q4G24_15110 [Paracoccus sp. (in: a-proteobacteria)]|uniref:hypothetical protein n=1 Tax=Paracoccus sp. TaxID=267 RepID=UPI0026E09A68|nr:hypothetical protein [Paracoccus sp. (in: a-proteobacteria)]MDO5622782.1 hypothetical protein [Paracoccus sp. (in: a-proteobacteria)]
MAVGFSIWPLPFHAQISEMPAHVTVLADQDDANVRAFSALPEERLTVTPALDLAPPPSGAVYVGAPVPGLGALAETLPAEALLVVNDCGWQATAVIGAVSATVARPADPANCDAEALRDGAAEALAAPERDRQWAMLRHAGFAVYGADDADEAANATKAVRAAGPLVSQPLGGLVITALDPQQMAGTAASPVIVATLPTEVGAQAAPPGADADRGILPRRAGLPEPSIIVGDLASLLAPGVRGPMGVAFAEREKIRDRDPELFHRLLIGGAFDPAPGQMAAAVQTELARMGCYTSGIDGAWGNGSALALGRYFEVIGRAEAATLPGPEAWRTIIDNSSARCPVVRAVTPRSPGGAQPSVRGNTGRAPATAASNRTPRTTPPRESQPAGGQQPSGVTAPNPGGERSINPNLVGSGVFR